ncbi:MAG TPA: polyprenyl synthetase family protein [Mucilaginibacter sp.]|jgi:geranylgeranyl diphosphate synthase type II|nr:polyprenyl synthetase family protein [Mucilaginibacter sp.]
MTSLNDLQAKINDGVNKLSFPLHPAELYEPIKYILSLGGKRMRPALLLMACDLFGGDPDKALSPALAIEVFHNFTLMHDDIMDNAPLRRGKTTVHEKWNKNVAILSGDVMLVESYKLIMQVDSHLLSRILNIFNGTAVGVCEGQQFDMEFEQRDDVHIDEYINMIRLKTAVLLGGALKIGAIIGGAGEQDASLLQTFGEQLGVAFQLQDDILDIYGNPEKFGKQVGGDILSNKKTFLLIKALELADAEQAAELNKWFSNTQFSPKEKIDAVTGLYDQLKVKQYAWKAMQTYADKAFMALDAIILPDSNKQYLRDFADGLMIREN